MNYIIFLLIILCTIGFFNPIGILSLPLNKLIFDFACVIGIFYVLVFKKQNNKVYYPRLAYIILLVGIVMSILMASAFHNQSIFTSIITTTPIFFSYLLLFVFIRLSVDPKLVIKTLVFLSFISGVVYFFNVISAPNFLFGRPLENEDLSRGILRIPIVFVELFPLLLFYAINQYHITNKKIWLLYGFYVLIMIFLSVTRQYIFLSCVLGVIYLFKYLSPIKRLIAAISIVLIVVAVLPQIPMYNTMLELSKEQKDDNAYDEDIRIKAWRFYSYEFQTNELSYFLGNGVPAVGKSPWGIEVESITDTNKCFAVDVGWPGFFFYFGSFATLALIWLIIDAIFIKKRPDAIYTTYWLVFYLITNVAVGMIIVFDMITSSSIVLYLAYAQRQVINGKNNSLSSFNKNFYGYGQLQQS